MIKHLFSKHNQELAPYTTSRSSDAAKVTHLVRARPRILFRPKDLLLLGTAQEDLDYQPYDSVLDYHQSSDLPITLAETESSGPESKRR